ncbi:MAG: CcoQ/FixQ family Cbb3-type cytochrome c oxidase assembly chaperone [Rhodospirillaceae bacterium]|nr:MAG: CcoQ/FixQ family Cbb3-type cytochrome c oxidase assembly chaperone [Rhodospirillaceae bacterium]
MTLTEIVRSLWVVWLMGIFFAIIFWALRPKNKKRFEDDAMIIFRNEKKDGGPSHG